MAERLRVGSGCSLSGNEYGLQFFRRLTGVKTLPVLLGRTYFVAETLRVSVSTTLTYRQVFNTKQEQATLNSKLNLCRVD